MIVFCSVYYVDVFWFNIIKRVTDGSSFVSQPGWPKEKILGFKWPKTAEMKFLFFSRIFLNMIRDFLVWQTIFADIFFLLGFFNENLEKKGSIQNETMYKLL